MADESPDYMTRTEVKNYVQAYTSEMVFGVLSGILIGFGLVTFLGIVTDEGLENSFSFDSLLSWSLFLVAGILFVFALLSARKKRKALED